MNTKRIITAAAATAGAVSLLAAGIAAAGPAPTGGFQMCGNVYSNSAESTVHDLHNAALPGDPSAASGDTLLSGYRVKGKINGTSTTYLSAPSNANGDYCMQGDVTMAGLITLGGTVSITNVYYDPTSSGTTASPAAFSVYHSTINAATFNNHIDATYATSATGFHVKL